MTDTDRMVVWLRETMDAAQRDAEAAAARAWSPHWEYDELVHEIRDLNNGNTLATIYHPEIGAYVAANGPAAVLRRIAADRKMLDLHTAPHTVVELAVEPVGELFCGECDGPCTHKGEAECAICGQDGCDAVRLLAEGYGWKEGQQ